MVLEQLVIHMEKTTTTNLQLTLRPKMNSKRITCNFKIFKKKKKTIFKNPTLGNDTIAQTHKAKKKKKGKKTC